MNIPIPQDGDPLTITNLHKPPIEINHNELTTLAGSYLTANCPVCKKGVLLIGRDRKTFILEEVIRCMLCSQTFVLLDIDELRENDPVK